MKMQPTHTIRKRSYSFFIFISLAILTGCQSSPPSGSGERPAKSLPTATLRADNLLIVDCLLPGQVRKLGAMTYLTARRPIRTSAQECEIRGGEYVSYDRSNYATALRIWLPKAEDGDLAAQNYLGEIYQKGMGLPPQYDIAARWFQKAADQGYAQAKINLGYLYEKGLGVPQDPVKAINLYREASGLNKDLAIDQSELIHAQQKEMGSLKQEIADREAEIINLRRQLDQVQTDRQKMEEEYRRQQGAIESQGRQLEQVRADLLNSKAPYKQATDPVRLAQLESELARNQAVIDAQGKESRRLKDEIAKLQSAASASANQRAEMERLKQTLGQRETQLQELHRQEESLRYEISRNEKQVGQLSEAASSKIKRLEADLAQREALLEKQRQQASQLEKQIAHLDAESAKFSQQLAAREKKAENLPAPTIEIIDPGLLSTRGLQVLPILAGATKGKVIGKVTAPAGVFSFMVNQREQTLKQNGMFSVEVPLTRSADTAVEMIAIDSQGKKAKIDFIIPRQEADAQLVENKIDYHSLDFGRYHALLIGNNDYRNFPKLVSPVNDVRSIAAILREKYGFHVKVLENATRFDTLLALDEYRRTLIDKDNFLLYYAGHGELDEKNQRGYWLPVDAESNSNVNNIPNYAITDVLNSMASKQAIIIADTCYSGIMTRSVISRSDLNQSEDVRYEWLKKIVASHSRTVLSSGGLKPVLDVGVGKHSVFARALIDSLDSNQEIMEAMRLYKKIDALVAHTSRQLGLEQLPQYAANLHAGHIDGDFLFVPLIYQGKLTS
jgi:hypothetical protein